MKDFIKWLGLTVLLTVVLVVGTGATVYTVKKISEYPRVYTANNVDRFIIERGNQYFNIGYSELKTNITYGANFVSSNLLSTNIYTTNLIASNVTVQVNVVNTNINNYSYTTNLYVETNYNDYSFTTNLYVTTNFNTYDFTTNLYVTEGYTTNLYVTTNYTTNAYITYNYTTNLYASTNYTTNIYVTEGFATNFYITTNYITNAYIQNAFITNANIGTLNATNVTIASNLSVSASGRFDNLTVTNGLTNTAIANAPFLKADANGKLTPTYDGWALTNLNATNMSGTVDYAEFATNLIGYTFPANTTAGVLTNDGAGNLSWQPIQTFIENTTWNIMNVSNINSTTNYTEYLTVNQTTVLSNASVKGGLTVNNVTITNSLAFTTNLWSGPTNVIDAQKARVRYHSYTPCEITGVTNKTDWTVGGVLLTIKNLAASNITVTLNGGFAGGARSHTITNGMWAKFSIEYDPSGPETNYVFRHF